MLSEAPRLHGQSCRISSAESKHPEKVLVYIPHQGIFPMPPPANGLGACHRYPPCHSRISHTISASGSHGLPFRDTLWREFPRAAFLPEALSGCFYCAPIRLVATDFLPPLLST